MPTSGSSRWQEPPPGKALPRSTRAACPTPSGVGPGLWGSWEQVGAWGCSLPTPRLRACTWMSPRRPEARQHPDMGSVVQLGRGAYGSGRPIQPQRTAERREQPVPTWGQRQHTEVAGPCHPGQAARHCLLSLPDQPHPPCWPQRVCCTCPQSTVPRDMCEYHSEGPWQSVPRRNKQQRRQCVLG